LLYAIERAQPRAVSFEESVSIQTWDNKRSVVNTSSKLSQLRENLANVYEDEDDYLEAAKILQGIPLDSGHR
jgi:COP9 signalosome complex subunit 4